MHVGSALGFVDVQGYAEQHFYKWCCLVFSVVQCTREGIRFSRRVECLVLGRLARREELVCTTKIVPEKYEP